MLKKGIQATKEEHCCLITMAHKYIRHFPKNFYLVQIETLIQKDRFCDSFVKKYLLKHENEQT